MTGARSLRPVPVTTDVDTGGFFDAAARGELALRWCTACDALLHLPKSFCHVCGSWETQWRAVPPTGTLATYTVVEHQVHPGFPVPHTLVLVELDGAPGARLLGHLPGRPDLEIGMAMRARFDAPDPSAAEGGVPLPQWEPVGP